MSGFAKLRRDRVETVSKVFKTVGQPTVTYVERDAGLLEKRLGNAVKSSGQLCLITGPSKTGKTTLYLKVLNDLGRVPLVVRCDRQVSIADFWKRALEGVDFTRVREKMAESGVSIEVGAELGGTIGWKWLAGLSGLISGNLASSTKEGTARELVLSEPGPHHLIPMLKTLPVTLVVEDYHYLSKPVQEVLFQQWKMFVDNEVSALVLGTTHHAIDIISSNKDLLARHSHIEVESWDVNDLEKIVTSGFAYLEVEIPESQSRKIARESVGLPIVAQSCCEQIFHSQNLFEHARDASVSTNSEAIDRALASTAKEKFGAFKQYYEKLIVGPRKRARKNDTYELVLGCFAQDPLKFGLAKHEIIERLEKIPLPQEKIPPIGSINSMLNALQAFQDKQSFDLLEYQKDDEKLHMLEPCFLFFVRWGLKRPPDAGAKWRDLLAANSKLSKLSQEILLNLLIVKEK